MTARDGWTYLDHAATSPLKEEVRRAMGATALGSATPSEAREALARALGVAPTQLWLTPGGSAANNLALAGARGHVLSQPSEHPSVLRALEALAAKGCEVELLPLDGEGRVDPAGLRRALRPETSLVTIMHANNETGCLQPIAELARALEGHRARLHVDAVQSAPWFDVRPAALGATWVTLSLHKLGGPRGIGVLLGPPPPQAEELALGTDVLAGAIAAIAARRPQAAAAVRASRLRLEAGILARVPDAQIHAAGAERLPGIVNISAPGVSGDALVLELERSEIAVATGAACASGDPAPSHVLRALGATPEEARASVRFSLGEPMEPTQIERVCAVYARAVERLRNLS
ncbi:MAG: aminotransferase class V-fold PLP-dependent enzyme [Planctomycetes bacterium]|nr:aminotransferase class V-fold PLP-dependent enzyme [Planctomycetota bacterium]